MQSSSAVQHAHDTLLRAIDPRTGLNYSDGSGVLMLESLRVLCWVLEDEPTSHLGSDSNFGVDVGRLEAEIDRCQR